MPRKKPSDRSALERAGVVIDEIQRLTEKRKALYEEHDELVGKLRGVSAVTLLEHGLVLENSFASGNTQWGHGPVREYKLSRPKAPKKSEK